MRVPALAPVLNGVFTLLSLFGIAFSEELRESIGLAADLLIGGLILAISLMRPVQEAFKSRKDQP